MAGKTDPFIERLSQLKQTDPVRIKDDASYGDVLKFLQNRRIGSVLICKEDRVAGIFTERDVLDKHLLEGTDPKTPIREIMTKNPVTITCDKTIGDAVRLMHEKHIRNLPMIEKDGRLVGLLTIGRLIRHLASDFSAEVVNLPPRPSKITTEVEGA